MDDFCRRMGWGPFFETQVAPEERGAIARIATLAHEKYRVILADGREVSAELSGRLRHHASPGELPAVGDWVLLSPSDPPLVRQVLMRKTRLSRQAAGRETFEQVLAANIEVVFIVTSLAGDLNPRRLERYVSLAWASNATPVILLSKADLCPDPARYWEEISTTFPGVETISLSILTGAGLDRVRSLLQDGVTAVILGSSGVGKSTLINSLLGVASQLVGEVSACDLKGKHTTTHRQLIPLPGGGLMIDTPGLRELQLWDAAKGVGVVFDDIENLAALCRFRDCQHDREPGCAIKTALVDGKLETERFQSYLKLRKEEAFQVRRHDKAEASRQKQAWKKIHQDMRAMEKLRGR